MNPFITLVSKLPEGSKGFITITDMPANRSISSAYTVRSNGVVLFSNIMGIAQMVRSFSLGKNLGVMVRNTLDSGVSELSLWALGNGSLNGLSAGDCKKAYLTDNKTGATLEDDASVVFVDAWIGGV